VLAESPADDVVKREFDVEFAPGRHRIEMQVTPTEGVLVGARLRVSDAGTGAPAYDVLEPY
jgi:hypothetical protein